MLASVGSEARVPCVVEIREFGSYVGTRAGS
jgi:hypothetical protein